MTPVLSPLRYPGSKARLVGLIANLLEENLLVGSHIYEPFAGGASVSLNLLANGFVASASLVERDPLVYCLWKVIQEDPEPLIKRIRASKVTLASWRRLLPLRDVKRPTAFQLTELAYAGLFFNRTCFSGIVGAGPIGGLDQSGKYKIDCRFNKETIVRSISAIHEIMKRVELHFGTVSRFCLDWDLRRDRIRSLTLTRPTFRTGTSCIVTRFQPRITNGSQKRSKPYRRHGWSAMIIIT